MRAPARKAIAIFDECAGSKELFVDSYMEPSAISRFDVTPANRNHHRIGTVAGVELLENALDVILDRKFRDIQSRGNDFVGVPFGYFAKHRKLPWADRIIGGVLGDLLRDVGWDAASTRVHTANRVDELRAQQIFQ
jgi:hypothetical protein